MGPGKTHCSPIKKKKVACGMGWVGSENRFRSAKGLATLEEKLEGQEEQRRGWRKVG